MPVLHRRQAVLSRVRSEMSKRQKPAAATIRRPTPAGGRRSAAAPCSRRSPGLPRQAAMRGRRTAFPLQCTQDSPRPPCRRLPVRAALPLGVIALSLSSSPGRSFAPLGRRQFHARATRFRQADRNRLLRRPRSVLAFANVFDLFAHELAGLRSGRLAASRSSSGPFHGPLFRHSASFLSRTESAASSGLVLPSLGPRLALGRSLAPSETFLQCL